MRIHRSFLQRVAVTALLTALTFANVTLADGPAASPEKEQELLLKCYFQVQLLHMAFLVYLSKMMQNQQKNQILILQLQCMASINCIMNN